MTRDISWSKMGVIWQRRTGTKQSSGVVNFKINKEWWRDIKYKKVKIFCILVNFLFE
jgi:hypothetical protein